jgi:V8-like Glu-specific endopeptidase
LFDHSSDTSGGHSGGPLYFTNGQPTVWGVHSGGPCEGACDNHPKQPRVSLGAKMTEEFFNALYDLINN